MAHLSADIAQRARSGRGPPWATRRGGLSPRTQPPRGCARRLTDQQMTCCETGCAYRGCNVS